MAMAHSMVMILLLATVAVLVGGVASMAHGGAFDRQYGAKIMLARVWLQGLTLAFLVLVLLAGSG